MKKYDYVKTERKDVDEIPDNWVWLVRKITRWYTKLNVWVYKKSGGRLMKNFPGGFPICIVTTTGKKTGLKRDIPLIHLPDGEDKLLVASQGGLNIHPVWYYNVKATPQIEITFGPVTRTYVAEQISSEEKASVWPLLLSYYPDFDEYQARTDRDIPVFRCKPVA